MKSGVSLGVAITGICAVFCAAISAQAKAPGGQNQITFPSGLDLGTVNIEREMLTPPYLLPVKPAFAKAIGTIRYPPGARLGVTVSYDLSQNPGSLSALNHPDIVSLKFITLPIDDAFVARLKGFKHLRKIRLNETE